MVAGRHGYFPDWSGWLPYVLAITGAADITNTFIAFGLDGGLFAVVLLLLLFFRAFQSLGRALKGARRNSNSPRDTEFILWGLGCMLVVHITTWFGITYFDQIYVIWFMQLAAVSSLTHTPKVTTQRERGLLMRREISR